MSGWTKGPWVHDECGPNDANVYGQGGQAVAHVYCTDHPDGQANARLIAAAPEMVELLREYAETPSSSFYADVFMADVRAILARIKGEGQ